MRISAIGSCFFVLLVALFLPAMAAAGTPDMGNSIVQDCLVTCPGGDTTFLVQVRDAADLPCVDSVVELSFCGCSGQQLCTGNASCGDGTEDILVLSTDANGEALFAVAAGGECDGLADIRADGVLLAQREVKPLDTTGNFIIELDDIPDLSNPANDYDCNGSVNLFDVNILSVHANGVHQCEAPVPVLPGSWGAVKATWR
jgi:hypothetical protein